MLTSNELKSAVDALWNKMRDGRLPNPLDSIEQLSFLLFMKRLDEEETRREQQANRRGIPYQSLFVDKEGKPKPEYRWSKWTKRTGDDALQFVKTQVFPFINIRCLSSLLQTVAIHAAMRKRRTPNECN